jgi:hypothetical protein
LPVMAVGASRATANPLIYFYTYITLHEVLAEKITPEAKPGALYLVYGFSRILPRYDHLEVMIPDLGSQGMAALYRKDFSINSTARVSDQYSSFPLKETKPTWPPVAGVSRKK